MKILIVTTRSRFPKAFESRVRRSLDLPGSVIHLLTLEPPTRPIRFAAVRTVDASVLPRRPLVPVSGPPLPSYTWLRRQTARALRGGRRVLARVPRPESLRASRQSMLATACRTSKDLHAYVATFDVVVSLEADAALGVWHLAQQVPGPVMVHRPWTARKVLDKHGVELPPSRTDDETTVDDEEQIDAVLEPAALPAEPVRLLVAPANYAGQAGAWARAVREHVPGATAMNLRAGVLKNPFPSDYTVPRATYEGDLEWRLWWRRAVLETFSHVIVEANQPVLGASAGTAADNVLELQRAGKQVALLSHGSDARIPSVHAARERWHQYDGLPSRTVDALQRNAEVNAAFYNSFEGPVFVSTLGLVEFIPEARWLPNVIDVAAWHRDEEPMERDVPVVAHVPSGPQKGSHMIDPLLQELAAEGVIEYRRIEGLRFDEMPEVYGTADIVVEQFGIADYSAAACEAMAAGRVVVSRVADNVRRRVVEQTGLELPIEEANPETLVRVIRDLVADRDRARALAARGREFALRVHDGRRSADVLAGWFAGELG